jgi:hypothetical protein
MISATYTKNQVRIARKKEIIILWISRGKSFSYGCAKADVSYRHGRQWKVDDEAFALSCDDAYQVGTEGLEDIADGRAKRRSDTLLMFLLKGRDAKYRTDSKIVMEVAAPKVNRRDF